MSPPVQAVPDPGAFSLVLYTDDMETPSLAWLPGSSLMSHLPLPVLKWGWSGGRGQGVLSEGGRTQDPEQPPILS